VLGGCIDFAAPPTAVDGNALDSVDAACAPGAARATCEVCDGDGRWVGCPWGCDEVGACLPATSLAAGRRHLCVATAGAVSCWTDAGAPWPSATALELPGAASVDELASGADHVCLRAGGDVYCVGDNDVGQCGQDPGARLTAPARVPLPAPAEAVFGGFGDTSCARLDDGGLWCWGAALDGQDALAEGAAATAPSSIGTTGAPEVVTVGGAHACSITDGAVACWGDNAFGQLGTGDGEDRAEPTPVPGLAEGVTAIAAGHQHTCAVTANERLWCWGHNASAQAGQGASRQILETPVAKGIATATALSALALGERHTLILDESGVIRCFGANDLTECGSAAASGRYVKTVSGLPAAATVATGWRFACALDTEGRLWCWGASPDQSAPTGATPHLVVSP